MTPAEFIEQWCRDGDSIAPFAVAELAPLELSREDVSFLAAGLPKAAAPFLSFDDAPAGRARPVCDVWKIGAEYSDFLIIGSNGSGDPVCLQRRTGAVVFLNHDARFRIVPINSSLEALGAALLGYRKLVREALAVNGQDAVLNNDVPVASIDEFEATIRAIDPVAAEPGTFWFEEIQDLRLGPDAV